MFAKDRERTRIQILLSAICNPVFLAVYGIAWYHLRALCRYGGRRSHLPVLAVCSLFFLVWMIVCIIRILKKQSAGQPYPALSAAGRLWYTAALLTLCAVTGYFGWGVVKSAMPYQGKLSWALEDAKNRRTIPLTHDNIFRDGIDEDGAAESFLISYDRDKAENMTVYLNGAVDRQDEQEKLLAPLSSMLETIPLEQTVGRWKASRFGILYYGVRSWGTDISGIVYIDSSGETKAAENAYCEIAGYTVSVYVPGEERSDVSPVRYVHADNLDAVPSENPLSARESADTTSRAQKTENDEDVSMLDESRGYRLTVLDAAAGSRFYGLEMTEDGGNSWEILNQDPFGGDTGVSAGISFLNETLGFIALSHSGGSLAELYRTEDGGATFERVTLPAAEVPLTGEEMYQPFDFPGMPYEKDGALYLEVGQGQDGDYNSGSSALYRSGDMGRTWTFVREAARDE